MISVNKHLTSKGSIALRAGVPPAGYCGVRGQKLIEYLVSRTDGDWFDFPPHSDPYTPDLSEIEVIDRGGGQIEAEGCLVSFSFEEPGVQVTFEGEINEQRARLVAEGVRRKIEAVSGQKGELVQIS